MLFNAVLTHLEHEVLHLGLGADVHDHFHHIDAHIQLLSSTRLLFLKYVFAMLIHLLIGDRQGLRELLKSTGLLVFHCLGSLLPDPRVLLEYLVIIIEKPKIGIGDIQIQGLIDKLIVLEISRKDIHCLC